MKLSTGVTFISETGSEVTISSDRENLNICGIRDGYVYFDNVYLKPEQDVTIDISDEKTDISLQHEKGETVAEFSIINSVPNVICDFKFDNLQPNDWYRLKFNGSINNTKNWLAHGRTSNSGDLEFNDVIIENE